MLTTTAVVAAGLAVVSQAFLLPPSVSSADIDIVKALPFESLAQANSRTLNLQCTTCPVAIAQNGGMTTWLSGLDSYLQLVFTVNDESDVLSMNGVQIYPPRFDRAPEPLIALQVAEGTSPSDATNQNLRLGYELTFRPVDKTEKSGEDEFQLLAMHFQVVEIGDKFVDGLESVEVKLIKSSSGKLMMADLETAPTSNPPIDPSKDGADCTTLICKFRAIVAGKLSNMKPKKGGCGSKAGSVPTISSGRRPHKHHGPRPNHHGHRHRHSKFGRFLHTMRSVAFHVIIPVFVGIAVGLSASIIGMIAGQMIVFFWRAIYRNGQGNYAQVEQDETEEGEQDDHTKYCSEKQGLPPVYDEILKDEKTAQ